MDTALSQQRETAIKFWHDVQHRKNSEIVDWVIYAQMKLFIECGELIDPIVKYVYHKKQLNPEKLLDELGDVLWYIASLRSLEDWVKITDVWNGWDALDVPLMPIALAQQGEMYNYLLQNIAQHLHYGILAWDYAIPTASLYRTSIRLCSLFGWTLTDVLQFNMNKLQKRHGDNFNGNYYSSPAQTSEGQL